MEIINDLQCAFNEYREKEYAFFCASNKLDDMEDDVVSEIRGELSKIMNYNSYDLNSVCENIRIQMEDDDNYVYLDFGSMDIEFDAIKEIKENVFPNNKFTVRCINDCLIITVLF